MGGLLVRLFLRGVDQGAVCIHENDVGLTAVPKVVCSYCYKVFTPPLSLSLLRERRCSKPWNGDLDFFEELPMTALLYRGHAYAAAVSAPKACVELTYRREHYNTCREEVARDVHPTLTYRGVSYTK